MCRGRQRHQNNLGYRGYNQDLTSISNDYIKTKTQLKFLVEKQMSIKVEEQEILRSEKELVATTRLPADAHAYETTVIAEGVRLAKLKQAEGEAQKIRLIGQAEASAMEAVSI